LRAIRIGSPTPEIPSSRSSGTISEARCRRSHRPCMCWATAGQTSRSACARC